jgi:formate C-acetyltransferase
MNLGGITPEGYEGANELSYLFLHAVGLLKQSSPTVLINWNSSTPHWLMKKAIEVNKQTGGGIPLFENDEMIVSSYVRDGVPLEEARTWFGRGCVWPALPQRSEYKGGAAAFNSAAALHMALHDGVAITGKQLGPKTGDPREFKSFDDLWNAYLTQHHFAIRRTLWLADIAREVQYKYLRLPFLSTMSIRECMDSGRDTMMPSTNCEYGITDRAIIDVADSLIAVKKLVFDEKKLTMSELIEALDSNFEGERGKEIQRMCLDAPKFGNDIDEVDELAGKIGEMSAKSVTEWDHSPYPPFKSVREGLSWHYAAGLGVGALPNGRPALEPLNDASASPMRGMDTNGPTAVLNSVLKANFGKYSYVTALNQKFPRNLLETEDGIEKLIAYTNAFLKAGGTHIQYNIVDTEELKDAKIKPEKHQDLIVRVGGFSAYFVQLSPKIQDDIIGRQEHCLC